MAYEEKLKTTLKTHNLVLEERKKLSISGVEDVERFDEDEIIMLTNKGALIVRGSNLHIDKLSLDIGEISIDGDIMELCYEVSSKSGGIFARLFG